MENTKVDSPGSALMMVEKLMSMGALLVQGEVEVGWGRGQAAEHLGVVHRVVEIA